MKVIEGKFGQDKPEDIDMNTHLHDSIVDSGLGDMMEGTYVLFANTDDFYLLTNCTSPAEMLMSLELAKKILMDQIIMLEATDG